MSVYQAESPLPLSGDPQRDLEFLRNYIYERDMELRHILSHLDGSNFAAGVLPVAEVTENETVYPECNCGDVLQEAKEYADEKVGEIEMPVISDELIESGVTNGWTWRKWESGVYECWGIFSENCTHYTVVTPFYGFYSSTISYPITFVEPPIFTFNCKVGNGFAMPAGDVMRSATAARCYALSTAKDTVTCVWEINVKGRWK